MVVFLDDVCPFLTFFEMILAKGMCGKGTRLGQFGNSPIISYLNWGGHPSQIAAPTFRMKGE